MRGKECRGIEADTVVDAGGLARGLAVISGVLAALAGIKGAVAAGEMYAPQAPLVSFLAIASGGIVFVVVAVIPSRITMWILLVA